jgi:hypothetical protein
VHEVTARLQFRQLEGAFVIGYVAFDLHRLEVEAVAQVLGQAWQVCCHELDAARLT